MVHDSCVGFIRQGFRSKVRTMVKNVKENKLTMNERMEPSAEKEKLSKEPSEQSGNKKYSP